MPTSPGRHCRVCRRRIPRQVRRCRLCGAVNLKTVDYALMIMLMLAASWYVLTQL